MDDKVKIIWSCNGKIYDERTVLIDEVTIVIGNLFFNEWAGFGQEGDKIEVVEVDF